MQGSTCQLFEVNERKIDINLTENDVHIYELQILALCKSIPHRI